MRRLNMDTDRPHKPKLDHLTPPEPSPFMRQVLETSELAEIVHMADTNLEMLDTMHSKRQHKVEALIMSFQVLICPYQIILAPSLPSPEHHFHVLNLKFKEYHNKRSRESHKIKGILWQPAWETRERHRPKVALAFIVKVFATSTLSFKKSDF